MLEKDLRKKFKKHWGNRYFKRIENNVDWGVPDIWLHNGECDIYVELKYLAKKFKNKKLHFKESQRNWFLKYPGFAYVLFQVEDVYYIFDKNIFNEMNSDFSIDFEKFESDAWIRTREISDVVEFFLNNK